jgi:O-antigen/teichoic acid export membrane protein
MSRFARNTFFNLAGEAAPLLAALVAIPILLKGIGVDRFGLLGIAWMVIGYASLFDFGLGRALTKVVSERIGAGESDAVPGIVLASMAIMFALGVVGALTIGIAAPWLVSLVKMPVELRGEALGAFRVLAFSLPLVIVSVGLRGLLEALHRFDLSNAVRIPAGVFAFVGPLLVLPFSNSLVAVVGVLTVGRFLACIAYIAFCFRAFPSLRHSFSPAWGRARSLLTFGSWMTVSNVVSPLMTVFDRFLIGALLSTEAVAYYTTSYDLISKMLVVSGAVAGVLFPTFAGQIAQDRGRVTRLFGRSVTYVFLVLFPVTLVSVALAHEGLTLWVGPDIASHSAPVLQILAVAILINGLALVPFTLIQAAGRPDVTAKLHLAELPFYIVAILLLTRRYGIVGAAIASAARMTIDACLLFVISRHILGFRAPTALILGVSGLAAVALIGFAFVSGTLIMKSVAVLIAIGVFILLALSKLVTDEDRAAFSRLKASLLGLQ